MDVIIQHKKTRPIVRFPGSDPVLIRYYPIISVVLPLV